jgi:flagellar biogenesis protein FliO
MLNFVHLHHIKSPVREKCHIPKTDSSIQSGKALSQLLRSQLNPHRDRRAIGGDYLYDKIFSRIFQ